MRRRAAHTHPPRWLCRGADVRGSSASALRQRRGVVSVCARPLRIRCRTARKAACTGRRCANGGNRACNPYSSAAVRGLRAVKLQCVFRAASYTASSARSGCAAARHCSSTVRASRRPCRRVPTATRARGDRRAGRAAPSGGAVRRCARARGAPPARPRRMRPAGHRARVRRFDGGVERQRPHARRPAASLERSRRERDCMSKPANADDRSRPVTRSEAPRTGRFAAEESATRYAPVLRRTGRSSRQENADHASVDNLMPTSPVSASARIRRA